MSHLVPALIDMLTRSLSAPMAKQRLAARADVVLLAREHPQPAMQEDELMTRIVEHRSALPFGAVVEMRVHDDADDAPVLASLAVTKFGASLDLDAFPHRLPAPEALLAALAYAEKAGIACVLIDDPAGRFPLNMRPERSR